MWLWILAAFAAFYIKGLCGFANTLVFTSILGFGANNINTQRKIKWNALPLDYLAQVVLDAR